MPSPRSFNHTQDKSCLTDTAVVNIKNSNKTCVLFHHWSHRSCASVVDALTAPGPNKTSSVIYCFSDSGCLSTSSIEYQLYGSHAEQNALFTLLTEFELQSNPRSHKKWCCDRSRQLAFQTNQSVLWGGPAVLEGRQSEILGSGFVVLETCKPGTSKPTGCRHRQQTGQAGLWFPQVNIERWEVVSVP